MQSTSQWLEDPTLGLVKNVRPSQVAMFKAVNEILNDESGKDDKPEIESSKARIGFFEGATGVGKSFAYLTAVILWAKENKKRVVIATAQKTLQTQLYEKDIPHLVARLGDVKYAVLKGKANYACRLRIAESEQNAETTYRFSTLYDQFKAWLATDKYGDLESFGKHLPFRQSVNVEECVANKCPHAQACGYRRARLEAREASVVVVNHALLAIDLQYGGGRMLGDYDALVIDEAHKAPGFFRSAYSYKLHLGVLSRLEKLVERVGQQMPAEYARFKALLTELFTKLQLRERGAFTPTDADSAYVTELLTTADQLRTSLGVVLPEGPTEDTDESLNEIADDHAKARANMAREMLGDLFVKLQEVCNKILSPFTDETDYLLTLEEERYAGRSHLVVNAIPIEVGPLVAPALRNVGKVVVTSATLAVAGDFSFMATEFGFGAYQLSATQTFESSFDYKRHSVLYIPPDLPPYVRDDMDTKSKLSDEMVKLLTASRGGAFILCASRRDLEDYFNLLEPRCRALGLPLMTQGAAIEQDVEQFRNTPGAVLLGLASLWEGVDVPGLALRLVIIPRLPFPNGGDALLQARKQKAVERMVANGMDQKKAELMAWSSFDYQVAAFALSQGAGRLVRSESDRGVVAVLDKRMAGYSKSYSAKLRALLPHPLCEDRGLVLKYLGMLASQVRAA